MKVLLIGSPGAGKSTLALQLAYELKLPLLHLDKLWHATDYSPTARETFQHQVADFMARHQVWLIDGNYANRLPQRLAQADHVIWLDYSRWLCLYRVLLRSFQARFLGKKRPDMAEQFRERFDRDYLEFLQFVWTFPQRVSPNIADQLSQFSGRVLILDKPRSVDSLVAWLLQTD